MSTHQLVYLVFAIVLVIALVFDLGLLSKKNKTVTIKQAFYQTAFWVGLALVFFVFMWIEGPSLAAETVSNGVASTATGSQLALEFLSAYLMEWSLSIDNIFVFILIFTSFGVKEKHYPRVLLVGILMAILFRIIFITVGVVLVAKFSWILYIFGVFLVYTGYKMFTSNEDEEFDPHDSKVYRFLKKFLPLVNHDGDGKYVMRENGRPVYTSLFVVVVLLAAIDLVFALDSIPAVMGISKDPLVIYTSNIFAVLGLRSLFFLLRGAVTKFDYLQQGIAIVLVFIGAKMLGEHYLNEWMPKSTQVFLSLGVIMLCISGSIFYSMFMNKKGVPKDVDDGSL
ncbi:MAG: TerC/Alx family metal homeostasis membrane protein [Chitinophagaceae bacterium]|nr:TerC/Alx family metal homeostasis membrane protein [Chitinophagaceae bacterium]MCA6453156.1 TerC/Alx family metal homeostasis membrane protein [Chitinophagaceae bacterium]MCA6454863.1 TerC/Alx family metal homeostasis membrane protein [Chitinophagaceae bacterium]MCA6458275.1 TerC/Alx family metal homeostasis membrane protein [Chitinophagaceae bacterium]MCA6463987.1 TerC/Alx family metal homeostasis membrane protein [Chitinophagaceae bacterium]